MTSSREIIPSNWLLAPYNRKAAALKADHQLENSCQRCRRFDMHDRFGHNLRHRSAHQFIVMGQHLTGGKGERPKKIEFCNDPEHLSFFHYGKELKLYFSKRAPSSRMVVWRVRVLTARVIYFSTVPSKKTIQARPFAFFVFRGRHGRADRAGRAHFSRRGCRRHMRRLPWLRCERIAAGTIAGQRQVARHGWHVRRSSSHYHRWRAEAEELIAADAAARRRAADRCRCHGGRRLCLGHQPPEREIMAGVKLVP